MMDVVHRGFDGLDFSLAGRIGPDLCAAMEDAKLKAQETRQGAPMNWNGIRMVVGESGARGGYAYRASTGPFGATWFFKKPNARDPWGIRVSCSSFNLATNGLGNALPAIYNTLASLGAVLTGQESIGRIDYAIDLLAPDLVLEPHHFVMHSNANRADHFGQTEMASNGISGRVTSVTVGKMPGRQVIVYDKRAEIIAKHKPGWWEIWNATRARAGKPPLVAPDAAQSRVWRVELRAGKRHLKDRWNIVTWSDLHDRFGDMVAAMLDAVRLTRPTNDTNRSRWPDSDLWSLVRREAESNLFEMRLWADPDLIKRIERDEHDRLLAAQMTGLLITRAALNGKTSSELPSFAIDVGEQMAETFARSPLGCGRKLEITKGRYCFD